MKRILCVTFALLLLVGCGSMANATASAATAVPNETASDVSSTVPTSEQVPFLISEHRDTVWADTVQQLEIDPGGQATMRFDGCWMTLTQTEDNTCLLTAELSENRYSPPVYGLRVAKLFLFSDGTSVRAEITEDPCGVFSELNGSDLLFSYLETYREHHPYRSPSVYPSHLPGEQPNTDWRMWVNIGEKEDLLLLHSDENGLVRGTWEHGIVRDGGKTPSESVTPCALLINGTTAAIVTYDEDGYGEALLFGKIVDANFYNEKAYNYSSLRLHPVYCIFGTPTPVWRYGGQKPDALWIIREKNGDSIWGDPYNVLHDGDYTLVMGVDQIIADYYLTRSGWTPVGEQEDYQTLRVYERDGEVLAIVFDEADSDFGLSYCAVGYVSYDPDGSVKTWGGLRPLDHTIVDQYEYRHGESDFIAACDIRGYYHDDHGYLYLTDDMRTVYVASWAGDIAFEVEPILPSESGN